MESLLKIDKVNKSFRSSRILKNISFTVNKGEVVGLLGENGAGKTTLMRILAGYLGVDSGFVAIAGYSLANQPILAKRRFGYLAELNPLYDKMTIQEYLRFISKVRGLSRQHCFDYLKQVSTLFQLDKYWHHPLSHLSKGFRRRVGLAQAIIHNPDVLLLDEPTDGLDPKQKQELRATIAMIANYKAIVVSTHMLEEVKNTCNRMIILHQGEIKTDYHLCQFQKDLARTSVIKLSAKPADMNNFIQLIKMIPNVNDYSYAVSMSEKNTIQMRISNTEILQMIQALAMKNNIVYELLIDKMNIDLDVFFKEQTSKKIKLI